MTTIHGFGDRLSTCARGFPRAPRWRALVGTAAALAALALLAPAASLGVASIPEIHGEPLPDIDTRSGSVSRTERQTARVRESGANATWNQFGTPRTLSKHGGFLATGVAGDSAVAAARAWLGANAGLFRLESADDLALYRDSRLAGSNGHAVHFRQMFDGVPAAGGGLVTVGLTGTPQSGWNIAFVSSSLTGDTRVTGSRQLSAQQAWLHAAANVGRGTSVLGLGAAKAQGEWTIFGARGLMGLQRVRAVAVPTPTQGVRPAWETYVLDNHAGSITAFKHLVDAETGAVLVRENLVEQSHPPAQQFTGAVPATDAACDADKGGWVVAPSESVSSIDLVVHAFNPANDIVLHLVRDGVIVASQDTGTTPEAIHYAPTGGVPAGTYHARVCDFADGHPWEDPRDYVGGITFNSLTPGGVPYPPKWKVFPAYPTPPALPSHPWNVSSTDIRKVWCWDTTIQGTPVPGCEDEVQNLAARIPWDTQVTGPDVTPTYTTTGNAADTSESWSSPLTPGAFGYRPTSPSRNYSFPWGNSWYTSNCFQPFVPGTSHDISAAVLNLFAMHNRMHDWAYFLGFTEENWNAQRSNFGGFGIGGDPIEGDAQAGAETGGYPTYLGRDNANMITLPDGVPSITNMYLWQPLRAAFYAPCVDGDYDMAVIGHEYGHMIENRMIGKGATRSGHHAGAMGESSGDLLGMEILNEFGFVPVSDENRYAVGAYATGNKQRGIRNYGMNQSPLNFSNMGYDAFAADPVHANGEIWSATNFDIRQALISKYNASFPASDAALQRRCADGKGNAVAAPPPAEMCPGNRRWIQIMFDAFLLMPTAPSMLDARNAYLAADQMRFGGANQSELWLAFARRGFGLSAVSTNTNSASDEDPKPDFSSPLHSNAIVTFAATASDEANAAITNARVFVGHYEARTSPIADTDPTTSSTPPNNTLDETAVFAPGTYEFLVQARGYGAVKFTRTFTPGETTTVTVQMPTNWASSAKGATATGDGTGLNNLIDDTEATNWASTTAPVANKQVTVDLPGTAPKTIRRIQVSASLNFGQNRFQALRQFRVDVSTDGTNFTPAFTSPDNAFPGAAPRPVLPELILRTFAFAPVSATHVRLVVLTNQCTGQPQFHGVQDADVLNPTDCRGQGEPAGTDPAGQAPPAQAATVRAAEFQVFGSQDAPTAVVVQRLAARAAAGGVAVTWRTRSETGLVGFNVWRSNRTSIKKVNRTLVAAKGTAAGAAYRVVDRAVRRGAVYTYRLQGVRQDGTRFWLGRVSARAAG